MAPTNPPCPRVLWEKTRTKPSGHIGVDNRHVYHVGKCAWNRHGFCAPRAWENRFLITGGLWAWIGRLANPDTSQSTSGLSVHFMTTTADPGLHPRLALANFIPNCADNSATRARSSRSMAINIRRCGRDPLWQLFQRCGNQFRRQRDLASSLRRCTV